MSASSSLPGLTTKWLGQNALFLDRVDSTNTWLMEHAQNHPHGTVLTAGEQTSGRARRGRTWHDEQGCGLAMSFLLRSFAPEHAAALPLVIGLGVCRFLEQLPGARPAIKWSNDVLLSEKKCTGILCESRIVSGSGVLIAGIGVNLNHTRAQLDASDLVYATSLFLETGRTAAPDQTASGILTEMEPLLDIFLADGFAPLRADYLRRCLTVNREILIIGPGGKEYRGTVRDIDREGALVCEINGKTEHIRSGEVSVRGLYGYV